MNLQTKNELNKIYRHFFKFKEFERYLSNPSKSVLIISRENLQKNLHFLGEEKRKRFLLYTMKFMALAPANIEKLKGSHSGFIYKLGMSATPDREYGEEGNKFIKSELGETFHRFGLKEAIQKKVLCSMDYFTQEYFLSDEERNKMQDIRRKHYAKKERWSKS